MVISFPKVSEYRDIFNKYIIIVLVSAIVISQCSVFLRFHNSRETRIYLYNALCETRLTFDGHSNAQYNSSSSSSSGGRRRRNGIDTDTKTVTDRLDGLYRTAKITITVVFVIVCIHANVYAIYDITIYDGRVQTRMHVCIYIYINRGCTHV